MFTLESFVRNERASGDTALQYITNEVIGDIEHFDPGLQRPYRDEKGNIWVDVFVTNEPIKDKDGAIVYNNKGDIQTQKITQPQLVRERKDKDLPVIHLTSNATVLRKDQWILIDRRVTQTVRKRLKAYADLRAADTFSIDGMSTTILEWEKLTDAGEAVVDMDGLSEGNRNFAPTFTLQGMPIPITHSDFWIAKRFLSVSRSKGNTGIDLTRATQAARRVAETIEQTTIGTLAGALYGDNNSYVDSTPQVTGYVNHAERITKTGETAPTASNGTTILNEWLANRELLTAQNFYGPYVVYVADDWDEFLDNDFKTDSDKTVRQRLLEVEGIQSIRRLDYLTTAGTKVWADFGADLLQAVNGMEITTMQYESKGGMQINFKVMGMQAPLIKSAPINTGTTGPASSSTDKAPVLHTTV